MARGQSAVVGHNLMLVLKHASYKNMLSSLRASFKVKTGQNTGGRGTCV